MPEKGKKPISVEEMKAIVEKLRPSFPGQQVQAKDWFLPNDGGGFREVEIVRLSYTPGFRHSIRRV